MNKDHVSGFKIRETVLQACLIRAVSLILKESPGRLLFIFAGGYLATSDDNEIATQFRCMI